MLKRRSLVLGAPAFIAASSLMGTATALRAATGNVIRFGQSAALTGGQANYGRDVRDGIAAAFSAANASGGGPRFELVTLDDGGISARCASNVSALIDGGVSAIIGLTSGPGAEACMSQMTSTQTALLGTASGSLAIRNTSAAPTAYHVRAGYDAEYKRMINYIKDFGMSRVGLVRLKDASPVNLEAMNNALKALSVAPIETVAVDRNATSFSDVSEKLMAAKLDMVLFITNATPIAAIINHMTQAHYPGLFYASSFAGQDLVDALTARKQSCIMSMVVPRPNASGVNVVTSCRQHLATVAPDAKVGMTTLEGYIAGRIAVEAAKQALRVGGGERVGRNRMRESLAGLRTDLGGYRVEFGPGVTQGSQYVDLIAIDRWGRYVG